jgi:hypothetical protein
VAAKRRLSLRLTAATPTHYVNHAEVTHTAHDFTLALARVPSRLPVAQISGPQSAAPLTLDAAVQLVIPPTLIPALIRVLSVQKEQYEKQFGEITDPSVEAQKTVQRKH